MLPTAPHQETVQVLHIISTLSFHHSHGTSLETLQKENSFPRKAQNSWSIMFQVSWGREGDSSSKIQKPQAWGASCCITFPHVYLRSNRVYDVPCFSCLGEYSKYEKWIKKQAHWGLNSGLSTEKRLLGAAVSLSSIFLCISSVQCHHISTIPSFSLAMTRPWQK